MAISKETIEEIRSRNNIVDVISSYVPDLRRRGGTFKCCCPFHNEKTPSFTVNQERQIFKCFGCGIGGDVFKFVQEYDKVDFLGAIQILADRVGVEVIDDNKKSDSKSGKEVLLKLHADAAAFYHNNLLKGKNAEACRKYLIDRDLPEEIIKEFQIGYASDDWEGLYSRARKKGYSNEEMKNAGLVISKKKCYDRFRNRLMFPISDSIGRVIGFSGRAITQDDKSAKYVNSPETLIFHKGNILFAFDKARKKIVEKKQIVIVEGQIDAIRCHQVGLNNVVASQGTALTDQHARLIKRYADEVILIFDADNAGVEAALKTSELFISYELIVRVAMLPQKEDPDSLIRSKNGNALRKLIDNAPSALSYLIMIMEKREDQDTEIGRKRLIETILKFINQCPLATWKREMLNYAAEYLNLPLNDLLKDEKKLFIKKSFKDEDEPEIYGSAITHYNKHEQYVIFFLIKYYDECITIFQKYLDDYVFSDSVCKSFYKKLMQKNYEELRKLQELSEEEKDCFSEYEELSVDYEEETIDSANKLIKKSWYNYLNEVKKTNNFSENGFFYFAKELNILKIYNSPWEDVEKSIDTLRKEILPDELNEK